MTQFYIPAVLRQEERVAGLVGIFINDERKRVQFLKSRPIDPAANGNRKAVGRIGLVADVTAGEQTAVIAGES
jgi:hypothetical protein